MNVFKCDLCGGVYESRRVERTSKVLIYDPNEGFKDRDCCPRCTHSIESMMNILRHGDDYLLTVYPKEQE